MKRFCLVLFLLIFSLCGCSRANVVPADMSGNFYMLISFSDGELSGTGEFYKLSPDSYRLCILEPAVLLGYTVEVADGVATAGFAGLSREVSQDDLRKNSVFSLLCLACRLGMNGGFEFTDGEDGLTRWSGGGVVLQARGPDPAAISAGNVKIKVNLFERK